MNEPIQLDGAPFEKAMQPVLNSLKEFRALVIALDQSPTGRLSAEMQKLKTGVAGLAGDLEKSLSTLPQMMAKQVAEASRQTSKQMRQAGKESADGFVDGSIQTVRARRQELQAQYESLAAMGKIKLPILQQAQAAKVSLFPEDAARLKLASGSDSANVLATQRRFNAAELAEQDQHTKMVQRAGEGLAELRARLAAKELADQQKSSNLTFRARQNVIKAEEAQMAERMALLGRASQAKLNNSEFNSLGPSSVAKGVNIGRVVDVAADTEAMKANKAANLDAAAAKAKVRGASEATSGELKLHAGAARELHSAYRGLASGFGAMWLTWGSVLPLLAGAAVSHAASQAVRLGAEVGQSLAVIQNLGGATAQEMEGLNKALLETSRSGPFGPKEVAKALETLSLAGLSAREQMEALKPTLDFSIAGQMSIEKGASALVAISTAFGYQAQDMRVVSDIITKTAAISMASAESMAASFKVASVVAQQYNVSLEDVATTLALLAQIGIKDQAAGTAVRQMYSELIGTSAKARKVMKETLKFDAFDELGKNLKPLPQMFTELAAAFAKLDFKAQNRVLLDMGNERATKAIAANLRAVQSETQKSAKEFEAMGLSTEVAMARAKEAVASNMDKIRAQLEDAPGFSALAAIGLSNSTENQMKTALSGLQTSLVEAFQAVEPVVARVATQLQMLFRSEGFREGLTAMVSGVVDLVSWFTRYFDVLAVGAVGYYAMTLAMTAVTTITTLFSAAAAAGGAGALVLAGGTATAGVAAAGAAVSFGALGLAVLPLTLLLAAAGGAYWFFTRKIDETAAARENAQASAYRTLEAVDKESERLRILIEVKGDEAAAREESARVLQEATIDAIVGAGEEKVKVLELASGYLQLTKAKAQAMAKGPPKTGMDAIFNSVGQDGSAASELARIDAEIAKIREQAGGEALRAQARTDLLRTRSKDAAEVAAKRRKPRLAQGDGKYDGDKPKGDGAAGNAKDAYNVLKQQLDNELKALDDKAKREDDIAKLREARIKSSYNLGITNFTDYQTSLDQAQKEHLDSRLADAIAGQKAADKFLEESTKRAEKANSAQAEGKKIPISVEKLAADQESARLKAAVEGRKVEQLRSQQALETLEVEERLASQMVKASRAAVEKIDSSKIELGLLQQQSAELMAQGRLAGTAAIVAAAQAQAREEFRNAEKVLVREIAQYEEEIKKAAEGTAQMQAREEFRKSELGLAREMLQYETAISNARSLTGPDGRVDPAAQAQAEARLAALEAASSKLKKLRAQASTAIQARGANAKEVAEGKALINILDPQRAENFGLALKGAFGDAKPELVSLLESMDNLGQSMTGVFGTAGDALGKLMGAVQKYGAAQEQVDMARTAAARGIMDETGQAGDMEKVELQSMKVKIAAWGDMAGAAQGFFKEGSAGYKTMGGVAKVAHLAQIAMNLVEMGQLAVKAVLTQAGGDPYSAFFRMAAMAAAVGALGFAVGGGFDKASDPANSSAERQKLQGSGTVLGDSEAKSSSLLKALEAMESNTFSQLKYSSGMLDALKSIQRSMAGLAQIILRTNGLTSGNPFGVKEGTINSNKNPLLDAIGAPTLESLFGITNSKVTKTVSDSGLSINGSLADLTRGRGFGQYADVRTDSSSYFGLVKKSSTSTQRTALDQAVADQLGSVFAGISTSLQIAATGFGADAASIAAQLSNSIISIPTISLRGLKGAELQEALNAVFSGAADKLARTVAPGFEALQKAGEGYFETVIRASNALATANGQLERLRLRLFAVSTAGAVAATKLTDLFGGINDFNAASQQFYNDYFSDAERAAQSTREMAQALGTVNLALPGSKDELRALAGTLDLTSDSGSKAFAVLLAVAPEFSATAELISRAAQDTAGKLLKAFTTDTVDFAGLRAALASQTTDVLVSVIGQVFDQLADRIKGTIDGIANERNAVRDAMLQINRPGVMGKDDILRGIADEKRNITGENTGAEARLAALAGARTGLSDADAVVAARRNDLAAIKSWVPDNSGVEKATAALTAALEAARVAGTATLGDPAVQAAASLRQGQINMVGRMRINQAASAVAAQADIDRATAVQAAAVLRARSAQLAYTAALQTFSVDASKSMTRLSKLREETMRYYDAQKQLADLMGNSAKGLRDTVAGVRMGQLSDEDKFAQLKSDYAKNYSMGLSTDGATLAGYGDKLSAGLTPLLEAAKNSLDIDGYAGFAATALARADAIAGRLETLTPKDFAADSLLMLGQIDAALVVLDQSSKSAEKIISDAVKAGADQTAGGLRAVIAALTGQPVPAFALGGSFGGGLRIVGENGPELEATGPSRIYSASQTRSLLGGGGNTARLEALIERQAEQLAAVNAKLEKIVGSNADIAASTVRTEQDGQMIYSGAGTPVQTRVVA